MRTWDSLKIDCPINAMYVQHSRLAGEHKSVCVELFQYTVHCGDRIYIVGCFSDTHIGYYITVKSHNMLYIIRFKTVHSTLAAA